MAKEINHRARQDIFDHCQWVNEWVGSYKPVPHVFSNLLEMIPKGLYQEHDDFHKRAIDIDSAGLNSTQFCFTHGGECPSSKPVDFDMSGLPCEDNSTANFKRMYLHGRFGSCYLVWSKYHREMATPLLVLENTPAFWLYLFESKLVDWFLYVVFFQPIMFLVTLVRPSPLPCNHAAATLQI